MDLVRVHGARPGRMAISSIAGLGGDIAAGLDQELKRTWGSAAYLRMALDNVAGAATFRAEITLDDERMTLDASIEAGMSFTVGRGACAWRRILPCL